MKLYPKWDKNLVDSVKILEDIQQNYWVCHGTLLGIIRDKNLIPWDNDIDLGVWKKNLKKNIIVKEFKKNKFLLKKKFFNDDNLITFKRSGGRDVDLNIYEITKNNKFAYQRHFAHSNFLMKFIYVMSVSGFYKGRYNILINNFKNFRKIFIWVKIFLIKRKIFYKEAGFKTSKNLFINIKKYNFKGLLVNIPNDYKEYFYQIYGPSWMKPQKKYNWESNPNSSFIEE